MPDSAIEIGQRLNCLCGLIGDQTQPQTKCAQHGGVRLQIDAVQVARDDFLLDAGRVAFLTRTSTQCNLGQCAQQERTRSASRIEHADLAQHLRTLRDCVCAEVRRQRRAYHTLHNGCRSVERAGALTCAVLHQAFKDTAEHLGIDREVMRAFARGEAVALEQVLEDTAQHIVDEVERRKASLMMMPFEKAAIQIRQWAECRGALRTFFRPPVQNTEKERTQHTTVERVTVGRRKVCAQKRTKVIQLTCKKTATLQEIQKHQTAEQQQRQLIALRRQARRNSLPAFCNHSAPPAKIFKEAMRDAYAVERAGMTQRELQTPFTVLRNQLIQRIDIRRVYAATLECK